MEALIQHIKGSKMAVDKEYAVGVILGAFDQNKDGKISEHEFVEGCKKWIDEAKQLAEKDNSKWGNAFSQQASHILLPA